jgi:hypothetical protein
MFEFGQEVSIRVDALPEELQYFPFGLFLYYKNLDTVVVELLHSEIQVDLKVEDIKLRKKV